MLWVQTARQPEWIMFDLSFQRRADVIDSLAIL
ncbi:hypothetical protein EMIT0158MI4_130087 [Burkholderia ambifaria]